MPVTSSCDDSGVWRDRDDQETLERLKAIGDAGRRGRAFEEYLRHRFSREHFKVKMNPKGAHPRQVDLMASRHDVTYLIEAKWKKAKAGVDAVDEVLTRLDEVDGAVIGVLVSWNGFTTSAIEHVHRKRARPVLLVQGDELERADTLSRLLRIKHEHLVVDGTVVVGAETKPPTRAKRKKGDALPVGEDHFVDRDGQVQPWVISGGDYGRVVYAAELPDIDWVVASGAGVTLDLALPLSGHTFAELLAELTDLGWTSPQARWSIQQAARTWHGSGASSLVEALRGWKARYKGVDTIHHTEEFTYFDVCDEGFYSLSGEVSADSRRIERHISMSMQLIGIPVRQESIRHLCDVVGAEDPIFYRPRTTASITRGFADDRIELDVIGFVTEDTRWARDDEGEWATGVVVRNPYPDSRRRDDVPEWWPEMLSDQELIVCELRSWHPMSHPKKTYRLWNCESAWTSDAQIARLLADWDDDEGPRGERPPRSLPIVDVDAVPQPRTTPRRKKPAGL